MQRIFIDDVPAPGAMDLLSLAAAPSLEKIAMVLLGAPKATGGVGDGVRAAIAEMASGLSKGAAGAVLAQLPDHVRSVITEADGSMSPEFGLWITDGQGSFATVLPDQALIGAGPEFIDLLIGAAQRVARQMAADPGAPADARYNAAAMLARPRLAVVG